MIVSGNLVVENANFETAGRNITVMVEDTSRADAEAILVAKIVVTIPDSFDYKQNVLPFKVNVDDSGNINTSHLTIRAHLPCHSGSDIRLGDMITTESISACQVGDINLRLYSVK
jgi:hypothetical protein